MMKKIILTIIYPFWFVLSKTLVGGYVCAFTCLFWFPFLLDYLIDLDKDSVGGLVIFDLFIAILSLGGLIKISFFLESKYNQFNYKTDF